MSLSSGRASNLGNDLNMKLRIFALSVAVAFAAPAFASTPPLDPLGTFSQPAAKTEAPVVKKKVVKKKPAKKVTKTVKKEEPKVEEKPKGFFATLFGSSSSKADDKAKTSKSKDAKTKDAKTKDAKSRDAKAKETAKTDLKPKKDVAAKVASTDAPDSFRFGLFGQSSKSVSSSNPDTIALDDLQREKDKKSKFRVKDEFKPTIVPFGGGYKPGTIVVKTDERRLYLVEGGGFARRYAIAVGREGLQFTGKGTVGDKQEWPRWIPTKEMVERDPKHYAKYDEVGMDGGPENPLGARAIYLYQGKVDTHIRVHGTVAPNSVGTAASNGCFRMINSHVIDLYGRVKMGAEFIVL